MALKTGTHKPNVRQNGREALHYTTLYGRKKISHRRDRYLYNTALTRQPCITVEINQQGVLKNDVSLDCFLSFVAAAAAAAPALDPPPFLGLGLPAAVRALLPPELPLLPPAAHLVGLEGACGLVGDAPAPPPLPASSPPGRERLAGDSKNDAEGADAAAVGVSACFSDVSKMFPVPKLALPPIPPLAVAFLAGAAAGSGCDSGSGPFFLKNVVIAGRGLAGFLSSIAALQSSASYLRV